MSELINRKLIFIDNSIDEKGFRSFMLEWDEPDGIFRPELDSKTKKSVGYHRGQFFHADPQKYISAGWEVTEDVQ